MTAESTAFLYPFIEADERDATPLLADLSRSAVEKWAWSTRLREETLAAVAGQLQEAGAAMAERFVAGGRLFSFGNGGSATDAEEAADLFRCPPSGTAVAARSLAADQAVLTALSNDIGFDVVFSRQLIAYARASDVALGLSTSGNSENLIMAFAEAKRRGLLTVGLSGYDGGRMASCGHVDHCFVVRSDSVHRIQESQSAVLHALWRATQSALLERGTT